MADMISGINIPDSKIAREAAELVRQYETEMLFNHSVRVFVFGAMKGIRQNIKFDSELLYVAALFHDLGLVDAFHTETNRFAGQTLALGSAMLRGAAEPSSGEFSGCGIHTARCCHESAPFLRPDPVQGGRIRHRRGHGGLNQAMSFGLPLRRDLVTRRPEAGSAEVPRTRIPLPPHAGALVSSAERRG